MTVRSPLNIPFLTDEMAKTKYDWSGTADAKKFESTNTDSFLAGFFKAPAKKN